MLSLKHNLSLHVEDWRVRMSFLNANKQVENSSALEMAIKITWFSDSVQAGIFVAEHEGWVKNVNLFKKNLLHVS